MEQKNSSRSRVKLAFFCIVGVHVIGLMVLLMQGCKRQPDESQQPLDGATAIMDTNLPTIDPSAMGTNTLVDTNVPTAPLVPDTTVVAPPPAHPVQQDYVIQAGDTFVSIGKRLNVPWTAIRDANPNVNPNRLKVGDKIVIPPVSAPTAAGTAPGSLTATPSGGESVYTVKSGDTLTRIARVHSVTLAALRAANPQLTTDKLKVGQKINIPVKAPAPAPVETAPAPVAPSEPVLPTPPSR